MHELAIAQSVVGIATRHAAGRRVTRIEMRIGHLRQVVPSALELGFELASQGTLAEGAALAVEDVPVTGRCRACGAAAAPAEFPLACPACRSRDLELTGGEELLVESVEVEVEDDPVTVPPAPTAGETEGGR